jgi:hypothetical protein
MGIPVIPKEKQGNIEFRIDQLHADLERLHSLYEQHFAGVLKRLPDPEHKRFLAAFKGIGHGDLRTTAGKFRFQGLQQKYIQFSSLWTKTLKQIEEGTYHRDLFLLDKKQTKSSFEKRNETDNAKAGVSKNQKALEALYDKMTGMLSSADKAPPKDQFITSLQKQIDEQKKKNPDKKLEVKLQRDANGKVQIKLGFKKD